MTIIDGITYLTVKECLERLPFRMNERRFRRTVRSLGIGIQHRWTIVLTEADLTTVIDTLRLGTGRAQAKRTKARACPSSSSVAARSSTSRVPSADSVMSRARELARARTLKPTG